MARAPVLPQVSRASGRAAHVDPGMRGRALGRVSEDLQAGPRQSPS